MQHFAQAPENYWTRVPGGKTFFQIRFDLDKLHPVPLTVGASGEQAHPQALAPAATPKPDLTKNLQDAQEHQAAQPHPHAYPWHNSSTDHNEMWAPPGVLLVHSQDIAKGDGARTDQSLMFTLGSSKGSFAKGAITDPSLGQQPARGSFSGVLGKDEVRPGAAPGPYGQDQNAAAGQAPQYQEFAHPFGTLTPGEPSNLRHYRYEGRLADVQRQVRDHGFTPYFAGGRRGKPDLANKNYNTGHLNVSDAGEDLEDANPHTTNTWRLQHELAHALTLPEVNKLYGEGRRIGKLGVHRSLNEARRAVHWEHLAVHKQRELAAQLGVHVSDAAFNREYNTVLHDAAHRAVTGKFTEPSGEGFHPHAHQVPLETAMGLVEDHARRLGLQDPSRTLGKAEGGEAPSVCNAGFCGKRATVFRQREEGGRTYSVPYCRDHYQAQATKEAAQQRQAGMRARGGIEGGGQSTPPKEGHLSVVKSEPIPATCPKCKKPAFKWVPEGDPICADCIMNKPGPNQLLQGGGQTTPAVQGHLRVIKSIFEKSEPQQSLPLRVEPVPMANDSDDALNQNSYTPEQARAILVKALRERIVDFAATLEVLQKRESYDKTRGGKKTHVNAPLRDPKGDHDWPKCEGCKKPMNPVDIAVSSGRPQCGNCVRKQHRAAVGKAEDLTKSDCPACGGSGNSLGALGARQHFRCRDCGMDFSHNADERKAKKEAKQKKKPQEDQGTAKSEPPGLAAVAPPAPQPREQQVRAATPGGDAASSFRIAWAGFNAGQAARQNATGGLQPDGGQKPDDAMLAQKQAVPVRTQDPRSNAFVTAGNNGVPTKKSEGASAGCAHCGSPDHYHYDGDTCDGDDGCNMEEEPDLHPYAHGEDGFCGTCGWGQQAAQHEDPKRRQARYDAFAARNTQVRQESEKEKTYDAGRASYKQGLALKPPTIHPQAHPFVPDRFYTCKVCAGGREHWIHNTPPTPTSKSEAPARDASGKFVGRANTLKPAAGTQPGLLAGDGKPKVVAAGGSGSIEPLTLDTGDKADSNKVDDPKGPKSKGQDAKGPQGPGLKTGSDDLGKADGGPSAPAVPTAKPPSGVPQGAAAPTSKPSSGGVATPKPPSLGAKLGAGLAVGAGAGALAGHALSGGSPAATAAGGALGALRGALGAIRKPKPAGAPAGGGGMGVTPPTGNSGMVGSVSAFGKPPVKVS
jgi:hypothetical protein